ncbi:MAG: efflux RND transporter permease subunit, partial [Verrucomicrobiales bacterium]
MSGIPGMTELRSLSKAGLSQVTLIFSDDTDLYRARQLVSERLQQVSEELPPGLAPKLAPFATGLGEIFYYTVEYRPNVADKPASRRDQLMQLKWIQDYQIKPLLRQTPGIAEVNTSGGYEKVYTVEPDPERLLQSGISILDLANRIQENTRNAGGGWVELGGEQLTVRANSRLTHMEDLGTIPLKFAGNSKPLRVQDVASIGISTRFRTGASTVDGQEAVIGSAIMMAGGNSRVVATAVREKLLAIQAKLSSQFEIQTLYDRSD